MKKKITVVKWVDWLEAEKHPEAPLGFLGGFFNWKKSGMRYFATNLKFYRAS